MDTFKYKNIKIMQYCDFKRIFSAFFTQCAIAMEGFPIINFQKKETTDKYLPEHVTRIGILNYKKVNTKKFLATLCQVHVSVKKPFVL